eukprot:SAG25_NODE_322_length_9886_cov_11.794217_8_plen_91_part_00
MTSHLRLSVTAARAYNLSSVGVTAANIATERSKLVAAAEFYAKHKPVMDISYDGVFYQRDVQAVVQIINHSKPWPRHLLTNTHTHHTDAR